MQICDKRSEQKTFAFFPEWIAAAAFTLCVGHKGSDQFQNVFFAVDIAERIIVHRLFEVDGVQDFHLIAVLQHGLSTFKHDSTFGLPFVKIKNQDAAVNSKVTSFRFFLNDFSHLSIQCALRVRIEKDVDVVSCVFDSHGQHSIRRAMFGQSDSFAHLCFSFYNVYSVVF